MLMNRFDSRILLFLNHFANRWNWFDWLTTRLYSTNLITCAPIVLLVWYALFDRVEEGQLRKRHELLLGPTLLAGVAVLAARLLALNLPFRTRPIWSPALHFRFPSGANTRLLGWSSFPSDHMTLFGTLATGILFVSRPLGGLALGWVTVMGFLMMYLGVHWPTDTLAGALLGVSIAHLVKVPVVRDTVRRLTTRWHREQPGLFFAALFLWTYQTATLFDDSRRLVRGLWHLIKR